MSDYEKQKRDKEFDLRMYQDSSESCNGKTKKKGKQRKITLGEEED